MDFVKKYISPEIEIIEIVVKDIMLVSGGLSVDENGDPITPEIPLG
jgi:hypothetical protein